ncbi:unnamed protein product [Phaedon cochleariae]|uniref:C2H2-type domain-containing protein n=1 Tax=Phaedon cochleariae TaxID=80249 RepID=A0A9P0DF49_PHACE|nr:unnamed protein product [Phaedon cochleariae]
MADDEYNKKLESLQQYIPFLDGMIAQLKDPNKKNREQQLSKMESLHAMITDRRKKLKLDTLNKCEDVISKLYLKVNHKPINHLKVESTISSPRSTPTSSSPLRHPDISDDKPLTLPSGRSTPVSNNSRIDVYNSAADSMNKPRPKHVSPKYPDISKPPISLADLKDLELDVREKINERASLNELNNIRNKIAHELILENIKSLSPSRPQRSRIAATFETKSNNFSFSEDLGDGDVQLNDSPISTASTIVLCSPIQLHVKPKSSPTVAKEPAPASIFGSIISNIDSQVVEEDNEKKERRSSLTQEKKSVEPENNPDKLVKPKSSPTISKEPASIFGSILSSNDSQVLEEGIRKVERRSSLTKEEKTVKPEDKSDKPFQIPETTEKDERRNSTTNEENPIIGKDKSRERRHSKDHKKSDSKKDKSRGKDHDSSGKSHKHSDKSDIGKKEGKDSTSRKDDKRRSKEEKSKHHKSKKSSSSHKHSKSENKHEKKEDKIEDKNNEDVTVKNTVSKPVVPEATVVGTSEELKNPPEAVESKIVENKESTTMYRRLADKYTKKPKKPTADASDIDKAVAASIEANMIKSPPKIPILNRLTEPPPPPPASLVKCSQAEPELPSVLQTLMDQLRKSNQESRLPNNPQLQPQPSLHQQKPLLSPNPLYPNRPIIQNPPLSANPPLQNQQMMPNPPLLPNSAQLLSPTDNFISEYVREEYSKNQNQTWPDRMRFEPSPVIPQNNRYIPPQLNQRFEPPTYNKYNQMDAMQPLDYYPPNNPAPTNQFNAGPPLLSPEVPHYHEPKPMSFGPTGRDQYVHSDDLRWRLDGNRPPWERREFDSRYRGPMTYREFREMRDNSRDPRVARENRDPRDPREVRDPREINRDPRNVREVKDPRNVRDVRDPRLNRDNSKDNNEVREQDTRDPRIKKDFERGRSRNREDYRSNKFESKFDRMYSRTNRERSRSRSRSRSQTISDNQDSFASPLDSLYSGKEQKVGKGYGIQSFRIPKIKKELDDKQNLKVDQNAENEVSKDESDNEQDEQTLIINEDLESTQELDESSDAKEKQTDTADSTQNDDSLIIAEVKENQNQSINVEEKDDTELESDETKEDNEPVSAQSLAKEIPDDSEKSETTIPHDKSLLEIQNSVLSSTSQDPEIEELVPAAPLPDEPVNEKSENEEQKQEELEPHQKTSEESDPKELVLDLPPILYPEESILDEPKVLETKAPAEQTILAQFFANLLNSQDKKEKKTALYSLISTFSDSFSPKELNKITKIIKAEDTDGSSEEEGEAPKKKEASATPEKVAEPIVEPSELTEPTEPTEPKEQLVIESPHSEEIPRRRLRRRIRRISSGSPVKESQIEEIEDEEPETGTIPVQELDLSKSDNSPLEDPVIVSVGERIKSRKRNSAASKPKKKNRSELDRLHEDIQDMFIRDGVLTATGKRMCHLLKGDPNALRATSPEPSKEGVEFVPQRRKPGPKSKQQKYLESLQNKEMRDMSVIIQKIPDNAVEESERTTRRLTRSMTNVDSDSEDDNTVGGNESGKEYSERDDSESSESEKETAPQTNDDCQKPKVLKRKRGKRCWASGIIKKTKKKKTTAEEPVAHSSEKETSNLDSRDFLEPDVNYYVDFAKQKTYACKLCDFQGKFITTHYKTAHPESEVLSSRFTPSVAAEAIADAKINLSRYEKCMVVRSGVKLKYTCRFCTTNSVVTPTFFYDHVSTHTGEYRHICPNCNVSFCNGKTLSFHMKTNHTDMKLIVRKAYNTTIMFGYLCGECNYVQISRTNVEEHVNIYHLVKPTIYKINLSTFIDDEIENLAHLISKKESTAASTEDLETSTETKPKEDEAVEVPIKSKPKPASVKRREAEARKKAEEAKALEELTAPEPPVASEEEVMVPPKGKKRGPKPGPRSKKKILDFIPDPESESTTDTESVSTKGKDVESDKESRVEKQRRNLLDTQTILPDRCKRAAKEKAQEKLKVIMEMSENLQRKKSNTVEDKNAETEDQSPETENTVTEHEAVEDKEAAANTEKDEDEPVKVIRKEEKTIPVKKEVEMNVFTCNTDLQEENRKIEQERLKKMEELNKTVGSRTSLNFVDKLCDRLSNNNILVKQEPRDDLTDSLFGSERSKSPLTMPVLEKNPPTMMGEETVTPLLQVIKKPSTPPPQPPTVKKPVLQEDPQPVRPSFEVTQKNDKSIVDMIEKLKGKLAPAPMETNVENVNVINVDDIADSDVPPPLSHADESEDVKPSISSTKILEISGLVRVYRTNDSTMFRCLIPPCTLSADNQDVFQKHYIEKHAARVFDRDNTLCETCGIQIEANSDGSLLENLFKHTISEHTDSLNESGTAGKKPQMIRIRKLSGDALSIIKKDWEEEIDGQVSKEADKQPVQEEAVPDKSMAQIELTEDNPFPFKISGVMSLAEPPPPLAPIAKQNVQLVVKEAKLSSVEIAKPKKTQKALARFIEEVSNLYKCPHYYCLFTTSFRDFLEKHLKAHNVEPDSMIPCVYCDMKTPWEHVAMHIDIRHANCRFACSYCLYRAAVKEYVFLHQDRAHPANDYSVIALPSPKIHKKFTAVDIKVDPKSLCEPYKCATYCQLEFLFENEFRKHLMDYHNHSTFMTCGHDNCTSRVLTAKLVQHWSSAHSVSSYQCGYCKTSHNDVKMMYHHFSGSHQNMSPDILIRLVNPLPSGNTVLGYSAEAFRRMRRIVAIPNTFTDDRPGQAESAPTTAKAAPTVVPFTKTALQVVPKGLVLPGASNIAGAGSFTLVTSASSIGTSSSSIILLSNPSMALGTLAKDANKMAVCSTVAAPVKVATVASPTPILAKPFSTATIQASQTPPIAPSTTPTAPNPVLPTTPIVLTPAPPTTPTSLSPAPQTIDRSPQTNQPSPTIDPHVAPLEHITLSSEEANQEEPSESEVDPLDLGDPLKTTEGGGDSSGEESEGKASEKAEKGKLGLLGYQLYRCSFCDFSCSNSNDFKKHCTRSMACRKVTNMAKPFECVHCGKCLRTAQALVEHMQSHGVLRYSCFLCMNKFATSLQARSHLKYRHSVNQTLVTPSNPSKTNGDSDEFIVKPKMMQSSQPQKETAPSEPAGSVTAEDDVYFPDQIDKIPIRSIFSSHKKCGICSYSTKVRTNLLRHLLFHSQEKAVSDTAPVNPVPCLEKNEKMFDKMINLASSSHASGSSRMGGNAKQDGKESDNLPEFVSAQYRFACCAHGCSYICPEESNLRHHVMALHNDDPAFACFHCKLPIVPSDVDELMRHLKLHGLQLFKCGYCAFVHQLRGKVERHIGDGHLDMPVKVVVVRNMSSEPTDQEDPPTGTNQPSTPQPPPTKTNQKPWRCCMCKTRSSTAESIQAHVLDKHEIDAQYKCALCAYKTDHEGAFEGHFKGSHQGQEVEYIAAYRKVEEEPSEEGGDAFDTTPLWQRDRPRVRHIRGILFDESSPVPAKNTKKTPTKVPTPSSSKSSGSSSLDFSIDAVAKGTAGVLKENELIEQVNKIMKHGKDIVAKSKETDVIVIDDDEENPSKTPKPKTTVKRKSIEVSGITKIPRLDDIIDLEINEDEDACSEKNLKQLYGQFGLPLNRQLRCPLCNNFKSKRMSDFIYHMFKEKKVYRFKCAICADESITYRYMSRHVKEHKHHSDFRDNIIVLPPNPKLEVWVQMLISHQCAKILPSLTPVLEALLDASKKVQCRYCQKWFKSEQEKNEHAIYHWRNVPYACDSCDFRGFTRQQIEWHFERMHTSFTLNILEKGPTVAGEIEYTDKLHIEEAMQEEEEKKRSAEQEKEVNVAEVNIPEVHLPEMEDESNQDGTVQGMAADASNDSTVNMFNSRDSYEAPNNLVIVTKTDTNVPMEGDVFCCEYCPYMSNSETYIMGHISGQHEHMHIKFHQLNRATCEARRGDYVGCMLCAEIGSEIAIRRHHMDKHDGQTFITYRYTCNICQKRFMKIAGLKNHSVRTHPSAPITYTGLFGNVVSIDHQKTPKGRTTPVRTIPEIAEKSSPSARSSNKGGHWLRYECPLCSYKKTMQRKSKPNVKLHVKQHFKSFYCGDCPLRFMNNIQAISHYNDKHPGLPRNINHDPSMDEQVIEVFNDIVARAYRVEDPFCSTPPPATRQVRNTAMKSTSSPQNASTAPEYSFYGLPPEEVDLTRIMTSVDINGVCLDMSADKLGKIFDLNPHVRVEDCQALGELESVLES